MTRGSGDEVRVALLGYGHGGRVFHAPLIAATPGMRLASVVTSAPERQEELRRRHPSARIIDDARALWESADDHDLIVVSTPNVSHVPLTLAALDAGLPVVIDKPMAATAEDGRRLARAAEERGLLLTVFQNRRWDGDFLTVRRVLSEERLGAVTRFESSFERWLPERVPDAWRERGAPEEAGGLLFDLGSHLIDQAVGLFGEPTSVYAELHRRRPGAEVDDDAFVALEHAGGVRSHLWASAVARLHRPRFRVLGLRGAFEKWGLDPQEDALADGASPSDPDWGREPPEAWGRLATDETEERVETERGAYPSFYEAVVRSLRSGAPPPVDPAEPIAVLELIEAAAESARTSAVVHLPRTAASS